MADVQEHSTPSTPSTVCGGLTSPVSTAHSSLNAAVDGDRDLGEVEEEHQERGTAESGVEAETISPQSSSQGDVKVEAAEEGNLRKERNTQCKKSGSKTARRSVERCVGGSANRTATPRRSKPPPSILELPLLKNLFVSHCLQHNQDPWTGEHLTRRQRRARQGNAGLERTGASRGERERRLYRR
eukprot:GHVS01068120.1.p2 GENE.GHVS01068120.1~~GHVS01068120.1.p2  ORF type:complete len:185 (+),score=28.49 GHVS01068120.1:1035-1589(+)